MLPAATLNYVCREAEMQYENYITYFKTLQYLLWNAAQKCQSPVKLNWQLPELLFTDYSDNVNVSLPCVFGMSLQVLLKTIQHQRTV